MAIPFRDKSTIQDSGCDHTALHMHYI